MQIDVIFYRKSNLFEILSKMKIILVLRSCILFFFLCGRFFGLTYPIPNVSRIISTFGSQSTNFANTWYKKTRKTKRGRKKMTEY